MRLHRFLTLVLVVLGLTSVGWPAGAAPPEVTATEVSFTGAGGVTLHGTVLSPPGSAAASKSPAMVMLQGAGNRGRQELLADAEAFARRGVMTLIYDKRTVGYSLVHRDYGLLADDALAGLRLLLARPDVDPARAGLWAASEGALAAPLAAARSTDVQFVIAVGAVGVTPAAQTGWQWEQYLRHGGVSGSLLHTMRVRALRTTIGAGLFAEARFDPAPAWERVRQPVLAEWGELDHDVVPEASSRIIREALTRGGNDNCTIRFVPGVRHSLHLTADGGYDHLRTLPADFGQYETAWIERLEKLPDSAGPAPQTTPVVVSLRWYEQQWPQLAAFLLLVSAMGWTALRRGASRTARWAGITGLTSMLALPVYLMFLIVTAANITGPTLLGRTLPWLALQLLAVAAIVLAAAARTWRAAAVALAFLPWAISWGLLLP